jgi:ADP-heptose:LPS heptosyltransferase
MSEAPRIAILSNNEGLGDCFRSLAMLRALKRGLPGHAIDWYSAPISPFARAMRHMVGDTLATVTEQAPIERPFKLAVHTLRGLPRYDLVIDTRTAFKRVAMARLCMRYRRFVTGCFGLSWADTREYLTAPRHHFLERRLHLVRRAIGREPDWRGRPMPAANARARAASLLPSGPRYVGFAPGASEAPRCWPLDRFVALAAARAAAGEVPVFLLGPLEFGWAAQIRAGVPGAIVLDAALAGDVPPLELTMALAERLALGVVNDSAVCHILAAFGVPLVVLYGPTQERRAHPFDVPYRAVAAQDHGSGDIAAIPLAAVISAIETWRGETRAVPASGL